MELKSDFALSVFDQLDSEQYKFLLAFLKGRGSLKEVQSDLQMSYPTVKKKLDELLIALNINKAVEKDNLKEIDVSNLNVDYTSRQASEIIKAKIKENGFYVMIEGIEDPYNFGYALRSLYAAGADGVILSGPEAIGLAHEHGLKAVASTMCGIYNENTARLYERWGADRLILPRDLALSELRAITAA